MRRVKELLRLAHELGYSKRQIALSIRMPKTTVGDYLARAAAAGLRYADVAGMSAFFAAAAELYRAEPWQSALVDHAYLFVTVAQLDLNAAVMALTGERGHSPGLVLLASLSHYSLYCAALPQLARGGTCADGPEVVGGVPERKRIDGDDAAGEHERRLPHRDHRIDHSDVEVGASMGTQFGDRLDGRSARTVGAGAGHGYKSIGYGQYT